MDFGLEDIKNNTIFGIHKKELIEEEEMIKMDKEINNVIWLIDKAKELGFDPSLITNKEFCDIITKPIESTKINKEAGYISKCSGVPIYVDENVSEPKVVVEFDIDLYYSL